MLKMTEHRIGKMLVKTKILTDHRGSQTRNLLSQGFLDSEASSSLSCSEELPLPRPIKSDGIIKGSPCQESSSHKASPSRSFVPEVPRWSRRGRRRRQG